MEDAERKDLEEIEHIVEENLDGGEMHKAQKSEAAEDLHSLLKLSEISLWLDTYEDIFSDFDPRPYSQRSLSDDFLAEAKKASREKSSGKIELRFLIPKDKRNESEEAIIKKRLHEHFRKHHDKFARDLRSQRNKSLMAIVIGIAMMIGATYVSTQKSGDFVLNLLLVVLEPGGWFITWFALDQLFYVAKTRKGDLEFYSKMARCDISFQPY